MTANNHFEAMFRQAEKSGGAGCSAAPHPTLPPPPLRPRFCRKCELFTRPVLVPSWANDAFTGWSQVCRHCGSILALQCHSRTGKAKQCHSRTGEAREENPLDGRSRGILFSSLEDDIPGTREGLPSLNTPVIASAHLPVIASVSEAILEGGNP